MYVNPIVTRESCRSKNIVSGGGWRGWRSRKFRPALFPFRVHLRRWAYTINLFAKRASRHEYSTPFILDGSTIKTLVLGISNIILRATLQKLLRIRKNNSLNYFLKKKSERSEESFFFESFKNSPISKERKGKASKSNRIIKNPSSEQTTRIYTHVDTRRSMPGMFSHEMTFN